MADAVAGQAGPTPTPLEALIRAEIAAEGPMPVARYMALCLGHPRFGYYITRDPLGAAGDFTTAPEISQMFGELIGLWAVAAWQQLGSPTPVRLVELGPGRGTLMADALRAARLLPAFGAAISVHLVETSPALRARQRTALDGCRAPIHWHDVLEEVPDGPALVIANEFFDALPIVQFVRGPSGWHERRVGLGEAGQLIFGVDPRPSPLGTALARHVPSPHPEGAVLEAIESPMARTLGARLATQRGAALIIDYGHGRTALGDTLQALSRHRFADVLARPGEADLTAHVDFSALARAAEAAGARAFGPLSQGDFLHRLGIGPRAQRLTADGSPATAASVTAAYRRLTGTGPAEMGALFKVLALCDSGLGAPSGFADEDAFSDPTP